jgi:hypothetical protein
MSGFVYSGRLDKGSVMRLIKYFFKEEDAFYISQSIVSYKPEKGLPSEILPKGQVFSIKGEIRWEEEDEKYLVILLSDSEFTAYPDELTPLDGIWDTKGHKIYLTPPDAPHIYPNFDNYPVQTADKVPKLNVTVYYKDSRATFVSPRRFKE